MNGKITNFYASGHTARGNTSMLDSSLQGLQRVYRLEGAPDTGEMSLIREAGNRMAEQGYDVWFIHSPSEPGALEAVVVPELQLGIVNGDLGNPSGREDIQALYDRAYEGFANALAIHDEWEKIYIGNMDFSAADEVTRTYTGILYGDRKLDKAGRVDHRFLGAATPLGAVDFVPNLTEGLEKRYFIKGRPGSGKSTMLKKLAAAATERGFDVEIYHCGFDPNSLDMIIVRELGFAMFDSTAPHEYFPSREGDEILDMYALCIKPGTDELYEAELKEIQGRYSAQMKQSIGLLAEAKRLRDSLK